MRKIALIIAILMLFCNFFANGATIKISNNPIISTNSSNPDSEWTIMVYLDGDNDLEEHAITDFFEMSKVGSNENVKIVVQFDRVSGYDYQYGGWTNTRRGLINLNDVPSDGTDGNPAWGENIGEINMGNPQSLIDFVTWSTNSYPANKYSLILWDHGSGWRKFDDGNRKSVCQDYTDADELILSELGDVFNYFINNDIGKIDLIGFDACLMGMIEVAYEIKNGGDYMTASEETEPATGWDYYTTLKTLNKNPFSVTGKELGGLFVTCYSGSEITLSTVDLNNIENLANTVSNLAINLQNQAYRNEIYYSLKNVETFDDIDYIDLYHFVELLKSKIYDSSFDTLAQSVLNEIDKTVISEKHDIELPDAHGISIYFPYYSYDSTYQYIQFSQDTIWDDFVYWYYYGAEDSNPPIKPTIFGSTRGQAGEYYTYQFTSTDPDGDDIYYYIQWDANSPIIEIGPETSGVTVEEENSWPQEGYYIIKAKAVDVNGAESDWSYLNINMPRNRSIVEKINMFFQNSIFKHFFGNFLT